MARLPPRSRAEKQLDALYAELPSIECRGRCVRACGPISLTNVERDRIRQRGHVGRLLPDLTCPLLRSGRCTQHAIRPLICRLYGVAEGLLCDWGCIPERLLSRPEAAEFIGRATEIGGETVALADP